MSHLLFIAYINDLLSINCNRSIFSFADDTSIIIDDMNKNIICNKSTRLSIVKTWFNNNLPELNLTQTCFINFSINKSSPIGNNYLKARQLNCNELNINTVAAISNYSKCNCTTVYPVKKVKYVCITIDANLKWQDHITNTTRKIRLLYHTFKTLINILSITTIRMVFRAMAQKIY